MTKRTPALESFAIAIASLVVGCISGSVFAGGEPRSGSTDSVTETTAAVSSGDLGVGTYSRFPVHFSVSLRQGYDDNVFTSGFDKQASWFTNGGIAMNYDFGSPRTQISLGAGAGITYYWDTNNGDGFKGINDNTDDYDVNAYISLSLVHKASPRLTFSLTTYLTYQSQPDFTLAVGLNRRSGNFFYTQDKGTVTYLWTPRFSTATSYTFVALNYDDASLGSFEDRIENIFGNEFRFLLWPTTTLVGEYRFQLVSYDSIDRDSTTHFVLGGFDHSFTPRFSMSLRAGAEFRSYDSSDPSNNGSESSPYAEATLNYALGKNTTVTWTNRYGIEEPDVVTNPSRRTFRTGLQVKHNFSQRISGQLGAFYQHDEYQGVDSPVFFSPGFNEDVLDIALSLRYAINHWFALEAGYNHTEVSSDVDLRDYSRNRGWAGVNLTF